MGCGCSPIQNNTITPLPNIPCIYTIEQVTIWKDLLFCVKDTNTLSSGEINKALGIVLSCIRIDTPCYLQKELDSIQPLITQIISLDIC